MRKSKKLIALSMAALMTAMTGCSGGQTASTQAESAAETQPARKQRAPELEKRQLRPGTA